MNEWRVNEWMTWTLQIKTFSTPTSYPMTSKYYQIPFPRFHFKMSAQLLKLIKYSNHFWWLPRKDIKKYWCPLMIGRRAEVWADWPDAGDWQDQGSKDASRWERRSTDLSKTDCWRHSSDDFVVVSEGEKLKSSLDDPACGAADRAGTWKSDSWGSEFHLRRKRHFPHL